MAVELDPVLLEVLACPAPDHAPLRAGTPEDPDAPALTCTGCGRVFPIRDGIPVLLLDEATGGPDVGGAPVEPDDDRAHSDSEDDRAPRESGDGRAHPGGDPSGSAS